MSNKDLLNSISGLTYLLCDDGIGHSEQLDELTYLLFLKVAEQTNQESMIPNGFRWSDLEQRDPSERLTHFKNTVLQLGTSGSPVTRAIYADTSTLISKPATLNKIISILNSIESQIKNSDSLGEIYDKLLEINASNKKTGYGQNYTSRVITDVVTKLMKPMNNDVIVEPNTSSAGFLISAYHQINDKTAPKNKSFCCMSSDSKERRYIAMDLFLHRLTSNEATDFLFGQALTNDGKHLPPASLLLTSIPLTAKKDSSITIRDDLTINTDNDQLSFLHAIYSCMLKPGARAAIIVPDNVLFDEKDGCLVRKDLMDKCNLHTILRLPLGIFHTPGIKANILFFSKPNDSSLDTAPTTHTWVYDLRTNMPLFGKKANLTESHFDDFSQAIGGDLTTVNEDARHDFIKKHSKEITGDSPSRLACFSYEEISQNNFLLDIGLIKNTTKNNDATLGI